MRVKPKEFNLNGHKLVLRNAEEDDAEMLLKYLKQVYAETPFLIQEPDEISLYEKLGFEKVATLPNNMKYADGTYTDVYFMVKYL